MLKSYACSFLASVIILNSAFAATAQGQTPPTSVCQAALAQSAPSTPPKSLPRKILDALLTFPIPYYPLKEMIKDTNLRFNILVEKPSIGVLATAVGVSIARFMSPNLSSWLANFTDSYVSYTLKDIVASSVALHSDLSEKKKYWINYLYTIGFYSIVTLSTAKVWEKVGAVIGHLSNSSTADINGASYAVGLVAFGVAWPLISQLINTNIVPPLLLNRFIKKEEMVLADKQKSPDSQAIYKAYEEQISKLLTQNTKASKREARYLSFRENWIKWRRDGLKPNDLNPFTGGIVKSNYKPLSFGGYYFLKTAVITTIATGMIIAYFLLRNHTVGTSANDLGFFSDFIATHLEHLRDSDLDSAARAILSQTPPEILEQNL